ncbi:M24 family metallopeptidase [Halobacterium yunchengense]|uniref:M24 family metallopeptidase n=1 Tax=Halobacterium yunchengense TaxID=3108497 RepID=UPI00300AE401
MRPPYPKLDAHLADAGADGFLVDADGEDSTQYYLSGYHAPDDFATLYADGDVYLLVSGLEYTRAVADSDAAEVRKLDDYGYREKAAEVGPPEAMKLVVADFVADYGVDSVSVPASFPTGTADALRDAGVGVDPQYHDPVERVRAVKADEELECVRTAQAANEAALAAVEALLADASVDEDGVLRHGGDALTSERVRDRIAGVLDDHDCVGSETIVACGPAAARAHDTGSGPLRADTPIVVDVFPEHEPTRYYGDVTRTFVKGEPSEQAREWYDVAHEAYEAALDAVEPGATGEDVHFAACDVVEDAGYPTTRSHDGPENGFFHSTGHGVGLDVHESPHLAEHGEVLEPGHVVTVEPGVYEQGVGGVRVEDLVVVTEDGYENLTDYPTDLRVL